MVKVILLTILASGPWGSGLEEDPLAMTAEMRTFFEQRVDRRVPPRQRVQLILSAIFDEDGVAFTYRNETRTAAETFELRSGDCLSFTNLFIAVARHFGLPARYREVDIAPNWSQRGSVVVFNRHLNSLVGVGSQAMVIDLVPQINRVELSGRIVSDERGFAHYYNNKGAESITDGDLNLARKLFEKALKYEKDASFIWANLGVVQTHQEDFEGAEESYRRAIKLDKHDMVALTNLVRLLEKEGRHEEVPRLQERIKDFRNKNPYYHYSLGEEAFSLGLFEESLKHYQDALRRKSDEPLFHHSMAKSYSQLGDLEKAIEHLKKARKYSPDEAGKTRFNKKLAYLGVIQNDR
jgi:tetratricopeptide (TPR) repeat protein